MPEIHDLSLIIDSQIPLIVIETHEERRALDMITRLALKKSLPLFNWTVTAGIQRLGFGFELERQDKKQEPEAVLEYIKQQSSSAIYVLCDFHPYLDDSPKVIRHIKDIALDYSRLGHTLIFVSYAFEIPREIKPFSAKFNLRLPQADQILSIVREEATLWSRHHNQKVKTDQLTLQRLVKNLQGLTIAEVRRLARGAIVDDGAITESDLPEVNKAKFELMDMGGVLSFEYDTARFQDVAGLPNLKDWLTKRTKAFLHSTQEKSDQNASLSPPKGILLLGIQGSGKSLAAKAVAGLWQLPLLRLDFGSLYNKFFGETEKNLRQALQLAELMSPCVLWLDEVEKGLGQDSQDQGVSKRLLGTLLTWMSEKSHPVFIVATANKVHTLPPELIRKGRLDEIFFVDLPDLEARAAIFRIHLQKRNQSPEHFQVSELAMLSEGFSGAEIEQAVVSSLYTAEALSEKLSQAHLVEELSSTQPLSIVMAEEVAALRLWAESRTVKA